MLEWATSWPALFAASLALLLLLSSCIHWLLTCGIDRFCAFLHYRTSRLKLSLRPRRIILIRHGESQGNVDKSVYQSIPDNLLPLTPLGRSQAHEAGVKLKALIGSETVLFYVSPFLRSQQTFQIISQSFSPSQYRVREDPRIREQEWGNTQQPAAMPHVLKERERVGRFFYRFHGGESGADVFDRVSSFLESLWREMTVDAPVQNIILVSHGLFMRLFLCRFYRWTVQRFSQLANPANCECYILEREDKFAQFTLNTPPRTYADKCPRSSFSADLPGTEGKEGTEYTGDMDDVPPGDGDGAVGAGGVGQSAGVGRRSRLQNLSTDHDAFSPRLTSQSLLESSFSSLSLHAGVMLRQHLLASHQAHGGDGCDHSSLLESMETDCAETVQTESRSVLQRRSVVPDGT